MPLFAISRALLKEHHTSRPEEAYADIERRK